MDILNWLHIKKQNLIRTTLDSPQDLLVLGADVSFQKRGDKYQSYAMPSTDFALAIGVNPQFISTTDGANVTGVTAATKSVSVLIPANTVKVGDTVFVRTRGRKVGTANIAAQSIYINTADAIGGNFIAVNALGATALYSQMSRTLAVKSTTSTETLNVNTGGVDDDATSTNAVSTFNINWAVDQYLVFGFSNTSIADATRTSYYEVTINKG
jgi:hypothetical protein